jgi:hypothetical protein
VKRISAEAVKAGTKEISDKLEKTTTEFNEFKTKSVENEKTASSAAAPASWSPA